MCVGAVKGGCVLESYFWDTGTNGPFRDIKDFNDAVQVAAIPKMPMTERKFIDSYRNLLCDTGNIYFTHADLNLCNIMIMGPPGSRRISGIIDWDQNGWYPECWEYWKMVMCVHYNHEWRSAGWVDKVSKTYEDEVEAMIEYTSWRGL